MDQNHEKKLWFVCHCDWSEMVCDGESIYRCSLCGWCIQLSVSVPPDGWYNYPAVYEEELLPFCLECNTRMPVQTPGWSSEDIPRPFRFITFWCPPSTELAAGTPVRTHRRRAVDAYCKQVPREEVTFTDEDLRKGVSLFFVESLCPHGQGIEKLPRAFDVTGQRPWVINISSLPDLQASDMFKSILYFEKYRAIFDLSWDENRISFRVGPEVIAVLAEALEGRTK